MKFAKDIQAKELLMCLPSQTSRATSAQTMKIKRTVVLSHHLDLFKGHDDLVELIGTVLKSLAAAADETNNNKEDDRWKAKFWPSNQGDYS